jgi:hypothetical protein
VTERPRPERPEPEPLEPPDSPEIAEVRRLLAEARPTEPIPADVSRRIEAALADLADETPAGRPVAGPAGPTPIASRRRRRRAAGLLVAAAAVVVGAVALVPQLRPSTGGGSAGNAAKSAAESAADNGTDGASQSGGASSLDRLGDTGRDRDHVVRPKALGAEPGVPVRHGRLVVDPHDVAAAARQGRELLHAESIRAAPSVAGCPGVPDRGDALAASYRRAPGALVYWPVESGSQRVDLYLCGNPRPVRSTTLPAP